MIYYQLISRYTDSNEQSAILILTRSCEDADYDNHLQETKLIAKVHIVNALDNAAPVYTEEIKTLTLAEFNNIVKGPDDLDVNLDIINEYNLDDETI